MFNKILRKIFININRNSNKCQTTQATNQDELLSAHLQTNLTNFRQIFGDSIDLVIREFKIGVEQQLSAGILYIDGLIDKRLVNEDILKPLMLECSTAEPNRKLSKEKVFDWVKESALSVGDLKEANTKDELINGLLSGETAIFLAGTKTALLVSSSGWETRGVEEPDTEAVVRGPREGFTENLKTNTALLRRKIKNPNLRFELIKLGNQTNTNVCITYIKGICNEKFVTEARKRLKHIKTDSILESGYIEAFIEDAPYSPFATVANSEKPDVTAAKILEGRLAVLVDGTPIALTVPYLFMEGFQSSEDYYSRPYYVTLVRWIRFLAFFITVYLPSLYVAATTFHQELIPTPLLVTMIAAKEGTPFPAFVEALLMGLVFEILREAGVRMPRPIGQAVSIVGALVIGEASVSAGLIGAPMVIVVALTGITSFINSSLIDAVSLLRLMLVGLAATMGFYGVLIGTVAIIVHLASLRSFGVPYFSPIAPMSLVDLKDILIRVPLWAMSTRPRILRSPNRRRLAPWLKPLPPPDDADFNYDK